MMSLNDFLNKLDLYGADLARWPQEHIKPALTLIGEHPRAKAAFDETEAMEALLRFGDPGLTASGDFGGLQEKVMAGIRLDPVSYAPVAEISFLRSLKEYIAPAVSGLMTVAIIGFLIGMPGGIVRMQDPFQQAAQQAVAEDTDLYTGGLFSS